MTSSSLGKIHGLAQNEHLKDLFDELVLKKQTMAEQDFWASADSTDKTIFCQAPGISNKPFYLLPRQNVVTQKTEFSLE